MSAELPEKTSPISNPTASSTEAPFKPAPPRRKILIGSQRPGVMEAIRSAASGETTSPAAAVAPTPVAPAAASASSTPVQTPVQTVAPTPVQTPTPVVESAAPVQAAAPSPEKAPVAAVAPVAQAAVDEQKNTAAPTAGDSPADASQAPAAAEENADRKDGNRADKRDFRGKKREPKVDPIQQILASAPQGKVSKIPVPSSRTPMSDELEAEYAAALGDLQGLNGLDNIISGKVSQTMGKTLEKDDKVDAVVVRISREDVILDLGDFNQGVVSLRQFTETPEAGTKIKVSVVRFNEAEGLYEVSMPNAVADIGDWSEIEEGMVVDALITGQNTGGLECEVCHIRAFMPAGQVSVYHRDNFDDLIGTHLTAIVTEAKIERRNLIVSHKNYELRQQEAEKKEFMAKIRENKTEEVYDAVVRKIMPFGCFVDIGHGVEGLVHISRLSWGHINSPSEVVSEGDMIKVVLDKVDDKGKLSFSRRDTMPSPWETAAAKYGVGTVCTGKVVKLEQFGAFVELEPGVEGLLHISELAHQRIGHVSDVVKAGQEIEIQVVSFDSMTHKIGLSMKSLIAPPVKEEDPEQEQEKKGKKEKPEDLEAIPLSKKFRNKKSDNLKGGTGNSHSDGEKFGLRW